MKKIIMYFHGGSGNHGCEAIVRATCKLLNNYKLSLYSFKKKEDYRYGLNEITEIIDDRRHINTRSLEYLIYKIKYKLSKDDQLYYKLIHKHIYNSKDSVLYALSIGGDNYCYTGMPERLAEYNKNLNKNGIKTILWGCSIEPELLKIPAILEDLKQYSLIYARESITYNALCEFGLGNKTILLPDSAFVLDSEKVHLPIGFKENDTVGINISPLVKNSGKNEKIVVDNYCKLIEWIIYNTSMNIALIPHVIWEDSDDRVILNYLYDKYNVSQRIVLIEDENCMRLKGYISHCRFFVGARTHSTIAAYSSNIPTLVMGYSVKARGIAQDLFGSYENYVVSAQGLEDENMLVSAFKFLMKNEMKIKKQLEDKNKEYQEKLKKINEILLGYIDE